MKYADAGWFMCSFLSAFCSSCHCSLSGARCRLRHHPASKQIEIDIAAAEDEAHALAPKPRLFLKRRGERSRARAFSDIVGIGPIGADRGSDLLVRDLHDVGSALADDLERVRIG